MKLREIVNVVLRGVRRISAENPKVAAEAKERYVREGTNVTLTCEADHVLKQDANVTTSWKFKEKTIPLRNDFRHEAITYRGYHSASLELVVRNASPSDSGDYACNLVNSEGSAMATTKLHVQSKGETSFPGSVFPAPGGNKEPGNEGEFFLCFLPVIKSSLLLPLTPSHRHLTFCAHPSRE